MKRTGFVISLNKVGKDMLFGNGQSALRINTSPSGISVKSARSDRSADAISMEIPKIGGPSARIDGEMAPALAKSFYKLGYSTEQPFFTLIKSEGGWWSLNHHASDDAPTASTLYVKMNIPPLADIKHVPVVPAKRGRKPGRPAKNKTVEDKSVLVNKLAASFEVAEIPAVLGEYQQRIYESVTQLIHSNRRGRKSADTVAAEASLHDFKIIASHALGLNVFTAKLRESMTTIQTAFSQIEEALNYLEGNSAIMSIVQDSEEVETALDEGVIVSAEEPVHDGVQQCEVIQISGAVEPVQKDEVTATEDVILSAPPKGHKKSGKANREHIEEPA